MNRYLSILLIFLLQFSYGQTKIEILKSKIDTTQNDTIKAELYRFLGNKYRKLNYDSAMYYYMKSIEISKSIKNTETEAYTLRFIGILQKNTGNIDSALVCYNKSLELHLLNNNLKEAAFVHNNIGIVYKNLGKYDDAISKYIESLKVFDSINETYGKALVYNNIGIVHKNQKKNKLAIEYYYKALEMNKKANRLDPMASNYNNIGMLLLESNLKDSAFFCFREARKLRVKDNDESGIADADMHIGSYYSAIEQWDKAINRYFKALPILEKHKRVNSLIHGYYNIAKAKFNKAKRKNNSRLILNESEKYAKKSLALAQEVNYLVGQKSAYKLLSRIYRIEKRFEKALYNYSQFVQVNDSLFNLENSEQMAIAEAKYNSEKKQLEIEKLENQKALDNEKIVRQELENKKKTIINYTFFIGSALLFIFIIYVLKSLKQKKKANKILRYQKAEIEEQNEELNQLVEEIRTQKEEIETQRDRLEQQKTELEEVNIDVSNSIEYAKKIQRSILSDTKVLKQYISDSFVFFKPRDVVSGDFYWWAKVENQLIVTAADSTGHGVPGAFMSMLGVSFLREIVLKEYITHPGVVLRRMRKEIINALRQKQAASNHSFSANKDGMDMALISLDLSTKILQYAGANNPLYIITKHQRSLIGFKNLSGLEGFYEIKPDKMPISIYDKMDRFETHEIQLLEGDQVYMFSDGFADQFGGVKGKKFKYKPFKRLLLENSNLPMVEQRELLYKTFMEWKGTEEQVDDIVVLGIRI